MPFTIPYISWGTPGYVKALRTALDAAGFEHTQIVGSDGRVPSDQVAAMAADPALSAATPILGVHYPCERTVPSGVWDLPGLEKTVWASEEDSGISDNWRGAGCWGRSLLQNYVKINATSTISWATLWAAYDPWMYLGAGVGPTAWEPWGGNYSVGDAVWTHAHVGQFTEPGWVYLGGSGTGLLPGGGSYTGMVPPTKRSDSTTPRSRTRGVGAARPRTVTSAGLGDLTLVIEKLEGDCLRCRVGATTTEVVTFRLEGALAGISALHVWQSNASAQFVQLPDLPVHNGVFKITVPRDTMLTLTTTTGQRKGVTASAAAARYTPFPLPYATEYETDVPPKPARFHADNEGAFEVLPEKDKATEGGGKGTSTNQVLAQRVAIYPMLGYGDIDPITSLGASDWQNYGVRVSAQIVAPAPPCAVGDPLVASPDPVTGLLTPPGPTFPPPGWDRRAGGSVSHGAYAGVCLRLLHRFTGVCLLVGAGLAGTEGTPGYHRGWAVVDIGVAPDARSMGSIILAVGALAPDFDLKGWHNLSIQATGAQLRASIDRNEVFAGSAALKGLPSPAGLASLRSGYHYSRFDSLSVFPTAQPARWPRVLFDKHLLAVPTTYPGGNTRAPVLRNNFTGEVGCSFTVDTAMVVVALGRFACPGGANRTHSLRLVDAERNTTVLNGTIDLAADHGDVNGYAWTPAAEGTPLVPGRKYYLVSSEVLGGDYFADSQTMVQSAPDVTRGFATPVFRDSEAPTEWRELVADHDTGIIDGACFGPLNLEIASSSELEPHN